VALVVVLTNGDPESGAPARPPRHTTAAGAVRLTIVGDEALTGVVLKGWALSADAAASAVATAGDNVRILRPLAEMAVPAGSPETVPAHGGLR
jgi:hypothetical protein